MMGGGVGLREADAGRASTLVDCSVEEGLTGNISVDPACVALPQQLAGHSMNRENP
jgi:hypothetical protein